MLLATLYSNLRSGESNLARCLASWYDEVLRLYIIECIGRSSIVPVGVSLYFLSVPKNFPLMSLLGICPNIPLEKVCF